MLQKVTIIVLTLLINLLPVTGASAFKLPDTGQTLCYDSYGDEMSCTGTGQDGAYSINPPSYTDNGDGTVTDNNTTLMWQKCSVGQNNDSSCSGTAAIYNWYQASGSYHYMYNSDSQNVCASLDLGSHSDWRLPSRKELLSIVDYSVPVSVPTIQGQYFPNTVAAGDATGRYWTSTVTYYDYSEAWFVSFKSGYSSGHYKYNDDYYPYVGSYVRCVRGGE